MNTTQQAKNGFKTFLFTFSISIFVFGVFYYLLSGATPDVSIESDGTLGQTTNVLGVSEEPETLVGTDVVVEEAKASPFGELAKQELDVPQRTVLAGADQTTESTVPETGATSITIGFLVSLALLAFFAYILFMNPRNYALDKFEKKITKDF